MTSFPITIACCETSTILSILLQYIYEVIKTNDTEKNTELGCVHGQIIILPAAESEAYSTNKLSYVHNTPNTHSST